LTTHLRPTAPIAPDVLLPGDPGLALALGQELLGKPLMANHSHGLWGYSGSTTAGLELTIQSSGIGGPSAAIVLGELVEHGARRALRVGTAVALDPRLMPGDAVVVGAALGDDGASRALGAAAPRPDPALTRALLAAVGGDSVTVASSDLFYDPGAAARRRAWRDAGAAIADLESAAVLALGAGRDLATGAALVVAESAAGRRADEELIGDALLRLGCACANALEATAAAAQEPVPEARRLP
jgi:uridine phosphorylase